MAAEVNNEEKTPTERDALVSAYMESNPESSEPDDASLYGFANERHANMQKKYDDLNGANVRLAKLVSKDPKLGAVLSMISSDKPKSFPYAIASVYGKEPFDLEGDDLEEFEKGYQENILRLADSKKEQEQAMKNIEGYNNRLAEFGKKNSLTPEQTQEINAGIMQLAENILMGNIPEEIIDMVYKASNYEKDVKDAADTGFVEGKNAAVEAKMKAKTQAGAIPDFGNATGTQPQKKGVFQPRPGSVYDNLKEIKS